MNKMNKMLSFLIAASMASSAHAAPAPKPCAYGDFFMSITSVYNKGALLTIGGAGNYQAVNYGVRVKDAGHVIAIVSAAIASGRHVMVNGEHPACQIGFSGDTDVAGGDVMSISISSY